MEEASFVLCSTWLGFFAEARQDLAAHPGENEIDNPKLTCCLFAEALRRTETERREIQSWNYGWGPVDAEGLEKCVFFKPSCFFRQKYFFKWNRSKKTWTGNEKPQKAAKRMELKQKDVPDYGMSTMQLFHLFYFTLLSKQLKFMNLRKGHQTLTVPGQLSYICYLGRKGYIPWTVGFLEWPSLAILSLGKRCILRALFCSPTHRRSKFSHRFTHARTILQYSCDNWKAL